jgi:hypothetical protein
VSKWVEDDEWIYLDVKQDKTLALKVLHTPGHTPDSISLYSPQHRRLFVGDNIYPFTTIHLDCIGSDVKQYVSTLHRLQTFIQTEQKLIDAETIATEVATEVAEVAVAADANAEAIAVAVAATAAVAGVEDATVSAAADAVIEVPATEMAAEIAAEEGKQPLGGAAIVTAAVAVPVAVVDEVKVEVPVVHPHQALMDQFFAFTGTTLAGTEELWSIDTLMEMCDHNMENMIPFFFNNIANMTQFCPPIPKKKKLLKPKETGMPKERKTFTAKDRLTIKLSCGHVEDSLDPGAIEEILQLLDCIRAKVMPASHIEDGYGEYTNNKFTIMMPLKPKWD